MSLPDTTSQIFTHFSTSKAAFTLKELRLALIYLTGKRYTKVEMKSLLPKDATCNLSTFESIVARLNKPHSIFDVIDLDEKGYITEEDWYLMAQNAASKHSHEKLRQVFVYMDRDRDGRVYEDQFDTYN
jgi:Ca2+-binding EF-hand superfamily protein